MLFSILLLHDNLTLLIIIAQSIKKDPSKPENNAEIHRRLRLGNLMVLTAQGTPFIHSGQGIRPHQTVP